MGNFKFTERITLQGSFGDRELRIEHAVPMKENGVQIVLLHGVHGCANLEPSNKYCLLATQMAKFHVSCWLVETTRKVHNRAYFADTAEWIKCAFAGKTYAQELSDVKQAVYEIRERTQGKPLWLCGFSLGGISACYCAADEKLEIQRLVVAGSGAYPKKNMRWMFNLPILNTLYDDISFDVLKNVKTKTFIALRGSKDEVFPRRACEKLYGSIKVARGSKMFRQFVGADHSLRMTNRVPDPSLMTKTAEIITSFKREDYEKA